MLSSMTGFRNFTTLNPRSCGSFDVDCEIGMSMYVQLLSLDIRAEFHIHPAQWSKEMPLKKSGEGKVPRKREKVFMAKQK
jgi:hypothetical protein